jgi:hypothetical protein
VQQKYRSVRRTVATFKTGKPDEEDNALTDSDQQYRIKSTNVARMESMQWAQCRQCTVLVRYSYRYANSTA